VRKSIVKKVTVKIIVETTSRRNETKSNRVARLGYQAGSILDTRLVAGTKSIGGTGEEVDRAVTLNRLRTLAAKGLGTIAGDL
jgi:hypothetical protein